MAYHVRIDRATQSSTGGEVPADRLAIDTREFLWLYVEAELPSGGSPEGEYWNNAANPPTRLPLGAPDKVDGHYRFSVVHYSLTSDSSYTFHFADNVSQATYEDKWEIRTLS